MKTRISELPGVVTVDKLDEKNLKIRFTSGVAAQEEILSQLVAMNIGIISFKHGYSSLEEAYLNLIKDSR